MIVTPVVVDLNKILWSSIVSRLYTTAFGDYFDCLSLTGLGIQLVDMLDLGHAEQVSWSDFLIAQMLLFNFVSIGGLWTVFGAYLKFYTFQKLETIRKLRVRELKWHEQGCLISEQVLWLLSLLLLHYHCYQTFSPTGPQALLCCLPD